jgi:hypothetical protein
MRQPRGQDVLCVARRKQESFKTRYVGAKSDRTLKPAKQSILRIWPVDKRVGNVRNDGPDLLQPEIPPEPDIFTGAPPNPL